VEKFNEVGYLSKELAGWIALTRKEFLPSFEVAERCNRVGMRILFDIPTENINDQQGVACAATGRMMQSFQASLLLAERGALADARTVIRSCSESVIAIGALKADPSTLDRLLEDRARGRLALANSVLQGVDGNKPHAHQIARLQAVRSEILATFGDQKLRAINWAEMAERAGLRGLYDMVYRLTSANAAHFSIDAAQRHIITDDNNNVGGFRYYPDKSDLGSTLFAANACILHGLGIIVEWFSMAEYSNELELCGNDLKEKSQLESDVDGQE
jgi:uncharacterized protein DUF5677